MIFEKDRLALHRFMVEWDLSHKDVLTLVTLAQDSFITDGDILVYSGDRKSITDEMGQASSSVNYSIKKLEQIGAIRQRGTNRNRLIEITPQFLEKIKSFCKL